MQAIGAAVDTLMAHPMRTALSTLGVVIGVASLVAILALADGLEGYSRQQIAQTTDLQGIVVQARTYDVHDGIRVQRQRVADVSRADLAALESIVISGAGSAGGVVLGLAGAFSITAGIRHLSDAEIYAASPGARFSWRPAPPSSWDWCSAPTPHAAPPASLRWRRSGSEPPRMCASGADRPVADRRSRECGA